jgi:hypothetical protein
MTHGRDERIVWLRSWPWRRLFRPQRQGLDGLWAEWSRPDTVEPAQRFLEGLIMAHETHRSRFTTGLLVLAVACLIAPGSASATHTLLEFESVLEELWAVDPAIEPPPDNGRRDFAVGGFPVPEHRP